jgi:hypothetical protein
MSCVYGGFLCWLHQASILFRNYLGSTFLGVGFGDFGGGGHLPFLSFFTQLVTSFGVSFFAGSAANDVTANIIIRAVINDFILFPYKIKLYIFMAIH